MTVRERTIERLRAQSDALAKERRPGFRATARQTRRLTNRQARAFENMSEAEFEARFPDVCWPQAELEVEQKKS